MTRNLHFPRSRLFTALLLCAGLSGAPTAAELVPVSADNQAAFGIQLAAPQAADATLSRRYPARMTVPNRELRVVSAPQGGMLEALLVAEGETVEKGQVLAHLRSPELLQLQGEFLEADTRLGLARSQLARDRELSREGIVAQRRLLESRAAFQELNTSVDRLRQRLTLAGMTAGDIDTLRRTRKLTSVLPVRAPLAGVVLAQLVTTGQAVAAAEPLYRIARLDTLWLEIHVPVDQLGGTAPGREVLLPGEGTRGRVVTVGRMVHEQDQGVLVRAEIHDGVERLRPGQFVEVQLSDAAAGGSWRVADAAVVRKAGQDYLLVARDGGFEPVPVTVRASEEGYRVVSGPLAAGDRVAVKGLAALKAAWLGGAE